MTVLETERLSLRHLTTGDAEFVHRLVNDPDWIRFIGDRNVHSLADAEAYIRNGPLAMYQRAGFGLYGVELRSAGTLIGICGLLERDGLDDPDLGFAFLPEYRRQGYAREAAAATLAYAAGPLKRTRVLAIVSPGNHASLGLLEQLGLRFERMTRLPGEAAEVCLLATGSPAQSRR